MSGKIAIGLLLIASGIGLSYFLGKVKLIKEIPIFKMVTYLNPGLVGVSAGLAFLLPSVQNTMLFITFGTMLVTMPILVFVCPKQVTRYLMEKAKKEQMEAEQKENSEN